MSVTLVATAGASNANSFITEAEADAYFDARVPLSPPWADAADPTAAIAQATRLIVSMYAPRRTLVRTDPPSESYYLIPPTWTGAVATSTQSLPWPRTGMYDVNGNAIASNVIPQALKDATAELAGQLAIADRTLDNAIATQGITSVKAGSVAVSFKSGNIDVLRVLPEVVRLMLVPSWITDEIWESIQSIQMAEFNVVS